MTRYIADVKIWRLEKEG